MRRAWTPLVATLLVAGCGSSDKPTHHATAPKPSRGAYTKALADVERQLGCGILQTVDQQGSSEKHLDRFMRRMAAAYGKASRRLAKLHPPADAVAPNANLAKSLSGVADVLRVGPVGLTDREGRMSDDAIAQALLPPAAEKALDQLDERGYPSKFEASNCEDADLLTPSNKA
jgi:hypothetical protein